MKLKKIITFLTAGLLVLPSCIIRTTNDQELPYEMAERETSFVKEYKVSKPASLDIFTSGGNIEISGTENEIIEVAFVVSRRGRVYDITLEQLNEIADVEITNSDSGLSISVKDIVYRGLSVGFIIKTPYETSANLNTSGGNIDVEDLIGNQIINTSGGNLYFNRLSGRIEANTSGGNIKISHSIAEFDASTSGGNISINDIKGKVDVSTSGGNIEANGLEPEINAHTSGGNIHISDVKGSTSVGTSGGSISLVQLSGSASAHTSGGSINASMIELTGDLVLETSGGGIDATIPSGMGLDLDLSGDHINTKLDNFSGTAKKQRINGQINGGGKLIRLSTSGGSVNLNYN